MLERPGNQHAQHLRIFPRYGSHLVEYGEAAIDLRARRAAIFDGTGEVLTEAGIEEIIVIPYVETRFGEEVRKILLEVLVNLEETGSRVVVLRR